MVEYEPDTDLRDTEQVPLLEEGGIDAFLKREVLPYAPDVWHDPSTDKVGYEINFTREFYKPQPLRTLDEIRLDIPTGRRKGGGGRDRDGGGFYGVLVVPKHEGVWVGSVGGGLTGESL